MTERGDSLMREVTEKELFESNHCSQPDRLSAGG